MTSERAAEIATDALIWLAARPEDLASFLGWSGAEPAALRGRAGDPEFLGFVLEFLLGSDERVLAFCGEHGLAPDAPAGARAVLPGGALPNWT
jgi:Protein of unknown function (DUF3572)